MCSLVCPISKRPINYPVRGRTCKHFQCFDLKGFIECNSVCSGQRWKCAACEDYLSIQNLEYCALTKAALTRFEGQVSSERDRVEFRSDESYKLLPPTKVRHGSRFSKMKKEEAMAASSAGAGAVALLKSPEVVELLDDSD